jgi:hypothetical protein
LEEILEYKNRDNLYQFLIDDFGFVKTFEKYDAVNFGNWGVVLSGKNFHLYYVNDRSFLNIQIISSSDNSKKTLALSFVQDLIYNPDNINSDEGAIGNDKRIEELNNFLKKDFEKINDLFSSENYLRAKQKIESGCKITFMKRFPGKVRE